MTDSDRSTIRQIFRLPDRLLCPDHVLPLAVITLLLAVLILLPNLTDFSMRNDEILTVNTALKFDISQGYTPEFLDAQIDDKHPPLYFVLLNGWMRLAGESDFALRTLTLGCTLLTAAVLFRLGLDTTGQPFTGMAAALLYVSMGYVIYFTHMAHNYSLLALTALTALFFYQRWWRLTQSAPARSRAIISIGVVLSTLALISTHYYGVYPALALNFHALIRAVRRPRQWLRFLFLQVIVALIYTPWLPVVVYHFGHSGGRDVISYETNLATVTRTLHTMLSGLEAWYVALLIVGLVAALRNPVWRTSRKLRRVVGLLLFFLLGSLGIALLVNVKLLTFVDRRMIYLLPPFALLMAFLLTAPPRWLGSLLVGVTVIVSLSAGYVPAWQDDSGATWGLQGNWHYRHGVAALAAVMEPGDFAYLQFAPPFDEHIIRFYAERLLPDGTAFTMLPESDLTNPHLMDQFMDRVWLNERLWVMRPYDQATPWEAAIPGDRFARADSEEVYWFVIDRFDVTGDERPTPPATVTIPDKAALPAHFGATTGGGMMALVDYGLSAVTVAPGQTITITPDWRAVQPPDEDYAVFVHLLGNDGQTVYGAADSDPHHLGRIVGTARWPVGRTLHDEYTIMVDPATPPGTYALHIGFYSRTRPLRLPVETDDTSGSASLVLAQITVMADE